MVSTSRRPPSDRRRRSGRGRRRAPAPRSRVTIGDVVRVIFRTIGELLFTAGLIMLFLAAFQIWGKQIQTDAEQERLEQAIA